MIKGFTLTTQNGFKSDVKLMRMKPMTDKDTKDYCKNCDVEPPAMRFKCPECEHNPDKQQIIINGGDVNECDFFIKNRDKYLCRCTKINSFGDIVTPKNAENSNCLDNYNCYYKQLARKTAECELLETQLESYHIGEPKLIQRIQELEQECEQIKEKYEALKLENQEGYEIVDELKQECEELKRKVDEYKEALEELREECEEHRNNAESYCASYQSSCVVNAKITDIAFKLTAENRRLEEALEEIEVIANEGCDLPCLGNHNCNSCNDKLTNYGNTCMQNAINRIIQKVKQVKN